MSIKGYVYIYGIVWATTSDTKTYTDKEIHNLVNVDIINWGYPTDEDTICVAIYRNEITLIEAKKFIDLRLALSYVKSLLLTNWSKGT